MVVVLFAVCKTKNRRNNRQWQNKQDVSDHICKLAKKGLTPSQIGAQSRFRCCLLFIICFLLFVLLVLFVICCSLFVLFCLLLFVAQSLLYVVRCCSELSLFVLS